MAIRITSLAAIGLIGALLAACGDKDPCQGPDSKPPSDRFKVLLKEVNVRQSANPFYHFIYDDSGYVSSLSYSEDLYVYHYYYKGGRIDSVTSSSTDARYFLYKYSNQRVSRVLQYDDTGLRLTIQLQYDAKGRVTKMDWQPTTPTPEEKHTAFTYYEDNNLKRLETSYPAAGLVSVVDFEAYDNKESVDGFAVYREFLEHVILLPAVRFQVNNPTRTKAINGPYVRETSLRYVYQGSLPVERHSETRVMAGPTAGGSYTGFTSYSYY